MTSLFAHVPRCFAIGAKDDEFRLFSWHSWPIMLGSCHGPVHNRPAECYPILCSGKPRLRLACMVRAEEPIQVRRLGPLMPSFWTLYKLPNPVNERDRGWLRQDRPNALAVVYSLLVEG